MEVVRVEDRLYGVLAFSDELLDVAFELVRNGAWQGGAGDLLADVHRLKRIQLLGHDQLLELDVGVLPAQDTLFGLTSGERDETVGVIAGRDHGEVTSGLNELCHEPSYWFWVEKVLG